MKYDITVTLGPASVDPGTWQALIEAGATAFRLNTSHLSLSDLSAWLERIQGFYSSTGNRLPVVLDLQGSKWRLGDFNPFDLRQGYRIELVYGEVSARPDSLPVPHPDFFAAAALSDGEIVLNDAKSRLHLIESGSDWLRAEVIIGGKISPRKGITFASSTFRKESLGEKDLAILKMAFAVDFTRCAISYVRDAAEMETFRAQVDGFQAETGRKAYLIAKLERGQAITEAREIAHFCKELWLCRGDLGAELGLPGMAEAAYQLTRAVREIPVPVILAGQVLEHMTVSPIPTRSEVYTIYDALNNGYRGLVLSDEVAVGHYPIESCQAAAMFRD